MCPYYITVLVVVLSVAAIREGYGSKALEAMDGVYARRFALVVALARAYLMQPYPFGANLVYVGVTYKLP
jgi:hypothetical protein